MTAITEKPFRTNAPFSYRSDPAVPSFPDDRPIIIFYGHCVLCSRFARFLNGTIDMAYFG
jgi:hypothetical protein